MFKFAFSRFDLRDVSIVLVFFLIFTVFAIISPFFLKIENLLNIIRQVSLNGIMAMGMTFVIVSGEIDLSVGAIYGLTGIITGLLVVTGIPFIFSILIGLVFGSFFGLLNGFLVSYIGIPSFITTLGMLNVCKGISLLITDGMPVVLSSRTVENPNLDSFFFIGQGRLFGTVPVMSIVLILIVIFSHVFYKKTKFGFHLRAVGGNINTAKSSGINTKYTKMMTFFYSGFLCGVAGVLNLAFITNVRADSGTGLELTVISSVIIGGTSLAGGKGSIIGTLLGILIIGILNNGLLLVGISPFWRVLVIGVVIISAVIADTVIKQR